MGAIANRLGIRITDGALFPYTDLIAKQSDMRPWHGPMDKEWLLDSRKMRAERLKMLEQDRMGAPRIVPGAPISIATADKDQLLDYVANEYGETLDARLPILVLRRQALALQSKQLDDLEAVEAKRAEGSAPAAPAPVEAPPVDVVEAEVKPRGLGRRAA